MKRAVYAFSTAVALMYVGISPAIAQSVPPINRLTPLQRQRTSRDLVPSSAQDFFRTGQSKLEQEIRWLTRQRSPNENLLKVSQGSPVQPEEHPKKLCSDSAIGRSRGAYGC